MSHECIKRASPRAHTHMQLLTTSPLFSLFLSLSLHSPLLQSIQKSISGMGNCIHITSKHSPQSQQIRSHFEETQNDTNGKMRVKIVVRKEELELLLLQLKKTGGKRPLEEVLGEIQRNRAKSAGWRPCLDTILETHTPPQLLPHQINT